MSSPRFCRINSIETSPVGDRVVLYATDSRKAVVLNPTGAFLWQALSTPQTGEELALKLQARFPSVAPGQIQEDVEACLRQLSEQDVLQQEA